MRKLISLLYLLLASSPAAAGWHSGGGDLFSDSQNPWWVENTAQIDYCIAIDAAHFGLDLPRARLRIEAALAYWQRQFRSAEQGGVPSDQATKLATQTFRETPCHDGIDLTFQLGILSPAQNAFLRHPKQVVAQAVRTDYDPVMLHGKGFVYVSPDSGELALEGSTGVGAVAKDHWQVLDGIALEFVLVHELGHVFGLQHRPNGIMEASWPAWSVSEEILALFTAETIVPAYFVPTLGANAALVSSRYAISHVDNHRYSPLWTELLGIPPDVEDLELRPTDAAHAELFSRSKGRATPWHKLGVFTDAATTGVPAHALSEPLVYLYLTPVQTALPGEKIQPPGEARQIYLPVRITHPVVYAPAGNGPGRPMALDFYNGGAVFFSGVSGTTFASSFMAMTQFFVKPMAEKP